MGKGFTISSSTKQKLNTIGLTESEIVGVNNFMPSILWTRNVLNAQDYDVTETSSFRITRARFTEKNGMSSSGKRKKHMNI